MLVVSASSRDGFVVVVAVTMGMLLIMLMSGVCVLLV